MSPESAQDRLKTLASRLNLDFEGILGELRPQVETPAPRPQPVAIELTDAAIRAAINETFVASEIGASGAADILHNSEVVMIGGRRRLRLTDTARGAILRQASGGERFNALLREAIAGDKATPPALASEAETRSAILRQCLTGPPVDLSGATPSTLRSAVAAMAGLRDIKLPGRARSLTEAQRLLERAEFLEPLRISIGAEGPWDVPPDADRFVGRAGELTQLRAFVDEIDSEGGLEAASRHIAGAAEAVRHTFGDRRVQGVRLIIARGGLGKSALIAKFVLDHALKQSRRFPFAYLDFDRAAIQSRDPRSLLLEVARQVALQFPEETGAELGALREQIRHLLAGTTTTAADADPFESFKSIVRRQITKGERALLVVLDTIENAQSDQQALSGLLAFVERLSTGGFTELRLVAAGRAQIPELLAPSAVRREGVPITLGPMSVSDARKMVQKLGTSLLGDAWRSDWSVRLAGRDGEAEERREPLSLRVAVEILRDEVPEHRDRRSMEIEALGEVGEGFVGKLYMNRVIGHVAGGEDVRKLAWPGLVIRRVSVPIIRDLLAPLLALDPENALDMFNALATQVWIVFRDGDVLRHQPDLRARTLPWMRQMPEFARINAEAVKYFEARQTEGAQQTAEWLYHRLLAGESPVTVDRSWMEAVVPFLRNAAEDFPPMSAAADYLAARTSPHLLPPDQLKRLSPRLSLLHVARTGPQTGNLMDQTIDPALVAMPISDWPVSTRPDPISAARTTLTIKTGRWRGAGPPEGIIAGSWHQQLTTAIAFHRARTTSALSGGDSVEKALMTLAATSPQSAPLAASIEDLATARICAWDNASAVDRAVASRLGRGVAFSDASIGMANLRTAMLFGDEATIPAATQWLKLAIEQTRSHRQTGVSGRELQALGGDPELRSKVDVFLQSLSWSWSQMTKALEAPTECIRFDQEPIVNAVIEAVRRCCETGRAENAAILRRFAAARSEDWLVPLAYAAYRATGGRIPAAMSTLYESYLPVPRGLLQRTVSRRISVPTDALEAMRIADEASDVEHACRAFLEDSDPTEAADLKSLLSWYRTWRKEIERLLGSAETR